MTNALNVAAGYMHFDSTLVEGKGFFAKLKTYFQFTGM